MIADYERGEPFAPPRAAHLRVSGARAWLPCFARRFSGAESAGRLTDPRLCLGPTRVGCCDCTGSYFESRYHAYSGISRYYYLSALVNVGLGVWGAIAADCPSLNPVYLEVLWICCFVEALVAVLVATSVSTLMRGQGWAGFALFSVSFYGVVTLAKFAYLILAAILVGGAITSSAYMLAVVASFGCHLICGSWFVLGVGLDDAIEEAVFHFSRPDKEKVEDQEAQTSLLK